LVLVNKKNYFLFTPLLHEFATGSVSLENLVEPIREIIRCCDYEFIHGEVKRIDLEKKSCLC
jgi:NADH dehydrogenase